MVALETSVVAQGLPHPRNIEAALACEDAVRQSGATPAAIAVLDGEVRIGLEKAELRRLAGGGPELMKIASRDLAFAISARCSGGTTVSATCEVAARAGIRIFATGGIGGVHRGYAEQLDASQDLHALARWPVAVVCAGAKSVLDLPKTLELLETLSVPVVGVGTADFPGFYVRQTGLHLEHRVEGAAEAAALVRARFDLLRQGGLVLALPPPEATSLPEDDVERYIAEALEAAERAGIRGKAVTPFLLSELVRRSGGKSLEANVALLVNNARFAGELAAAYAATKRVRSRRRRPARGR